MSILDIENGLEEAPRFGKIYKALLYHVNPKKSRAVPEWKVFGAQPWLSLVTANKLEKTNFGKR